ncbi:MAG: T9SS type A sorting domain-containing protein, partial [Candidatus Cloacimonetes bacterium]|nr:T9SS type A sorting domain-containing protein [Candidatus Cloacimonadota bacterium]
ENLVAAVQGTNVTLNWDAPGSGGGGGEEGWIHYDNENGGNSIGTGAAADFDVAANWDAMGDTNSIYPYVGMNITKIQFFPAEANCEYAVRIWTGTAHSLVVDQAVTAPVIGQWNEIILDTPFTIPAGQSLMAGYRCNTQTGYPAGIDDGPTVNGYGNMLNLGGWDTLFDNAGLEGNWNIRVYVADADGREYAIGELPQNPTFAEGTLQSAPTHSSVRGTRATGYRIYRDDVMIDEVAATVLTYTDNNVEGGVHTYHVTAMYDANESPASNPAVVFVLPSLHGESYYDDGSAEEGLNVGSSRQMAVLHNFYNDTVTVKYAKIYVHTPSTASIIVRLYDNDGVDGLPNTMITQVQYPAASVIQGWNYVAFPEDVIVPDGSFYMAIMETPNASMIGVDTSSNGHSVTNLGSGWTPYETGEIMIRAIVYTGTANENELNPAITLAASNYPNPFNPETTISYSVPESGMTSVKVFNLKGQIVNTLVDTDMTSGKHSVVWNGTDLNGKAVSSGIYFVRVENSGKAVTQKMLLSK